jgi:hypothetical protein
MMATYRVTSDRFDGKKRGELLHDNDLIGVNIDALVSGGHIEQVRGTKPDKSTQESE